MKGLAPIPNKLHDMPQVNVRPGLKAAGVLFAGPAMTDEPVFPLTLPSTLPDHIERAVLCRELGQFARDIEDTPRALRLNRLPNLVRRMLRRLEAAKVDGK